MSQSVTSLHHYLQTGDCWDAEEHVGASNRHTKKQDISLLKLQYSTAYAANGLKYYAIDEEMASDFIFLDSG